MTEPEVEGKLKYILIEISKALGTENNLIELLEHSSFEFEKHWNNRTFPNAFNLELKLTPDIYTKNYSLVRTYEQLIKRRLNDSSTYAPFLIERVIGYLVLLLTIN